MRGSSMLLLVAGVIAGGCSADATTAPPKLVSEATPEAVSTPVTGALQAAVAVAPEEPTADAIDGALGRLLPSLGDDGVSLRRPLMTLKANRNDVAARTDLRRLLDQLDAAAPATYRADLDALRLELGVPKN
jgi:hypothetical protein